jgi:hypothetical protein
MAPDTVDTQLDAQLPNARRDAPEQLTLPQIEASAPSSQAQPDRASHDPNLQHAAGERVAPVWLQRLSLFVLVLFCVYLGVLVMVLPWWTRVWDENLWIQSRPALAAVLHNGAIRGVISGLGLLDIWIGISEAVHYRDHRG